MYYLLDPPCLSYDFYLVNSSKILLKVGKETGSIQQVWVKQKYKNYPLQCEGSHHAREDTAALVSKIRATIYLVDNIFYKWKRKPQCKVQIFHGEAFIK